jgi:hypothetical protein
VRSILLKKLRHSADRRDAACAVAPIVFWVKQLGVKPEMIQELQRCISWQIGLRKSMGLS